MFRCAAYFEKRFEEKRKTAVRIGWQKSKFEATINLSDKKKSETQSHVKKTRPTFLEESSLEVSRFTDYPSPRNCFCKILIRDPKSKLESFSVKTSKGSTFLQRLESFWIFKSWVVFFLSFSSLC